MEPAFEPRRPLTYRGLDAWRLSKDLAAGVFRITDEEPLRGRRSLCDQMQRAAVSVPSNIAEGEERGSNKEALRFLYIAKGSLAELRTQAEIALAIGDLSAESATRLDATADQVARLLSGMIKRRVDKERSAHRPS